MLYLVSATLALLIPVPQPALVMPAPAAHVTMATASLIAAGQPDNGLFPPTSTMISGKLLEATKAGDVFEGSTDTLSLSELIDSSASARSNPTWPCSAHALVVSLPSAADPDMCLRLAMPVCALAQSRRRTSISTATRASSATLAVWSGSSRSRPRMRSRRGPSTRR